MIREPISRSTRDIRLSACDGPRREVHQMPEAPAPVNEYCRLTSVGEMTSFIVLFVSKVETGRRTAL